MTIWDGLSIFGSLLSLVLGGLLAEWKSDMAAMRDEIKELREECRKNEARIDAYQKNEYLTNRKLDRVIDYCRMQTREMRDVLSINKKGQVLAPEHIEKLESLPTIDDVLKEF